MVSYVSQAPARQRPLPSVGPPEWLSSSTSLSPVHLGLAQGPMAAHLPNLFQRPPDGAAGAQIRLAHRQHQGPLAATFAGRQRTGRPPDGPVTQTGGSLNPAVNRPPEPEQLQTAPAGLMMTAPTSRSPAIVLEQGSQPTDEPDESAPNDPAEEPADGSVGPSQSAPAGTGPALPDKAGQIGAPSSAQEGSVARGVLGSPGPAVEAGAGSQQQQQQKQRPPAGRELLVGPFKSEADAPATITLAGVVYQKSGTSSALIRSQALASGWPAAETLAAGGSSASSGDLPKLWPIQLASGSSPSSSQSARPGGTPLAGHSNILLGSLRPGGSEPSLGLASIGAEEVGAEQANQATGQLALRLPAVASSSLLANLGLVGHQLLLPTLPADGSTPQASASLTSGRPSAAKQVASGQAAEESLAAGGSSNQGQVLAANPAVWLKSVPGPSQQEVEGQQLGAAGSEPKHSREKEKLGGPIVIVQRDVKPVKYHLLRAYLRLRRLLRPFEATYVFPGEPAGRLLGRRRHWRRHRAASGRASL